MTANRKLPITGKLEQGTPEHSIPDAEAPNQEAQVPLETFMQSTRDEPDTQDEPLHIVPILSEAGDFQGYFLPVMPGNSPTGQAGTGDSIVSDVLNAPSMATVILTPPVQPAPIIRTALATPARQTTREATIATVVSVFLVCSIVFFTLATALYAAFASITITITPQEQHLSTTLALHLVTGVPTSLTQVEARRLTPLSLSQALSTQATGSYQQQPTYSLGYLTFYNGSFVSVTIQAGSQFTGQDGVGVITTKTVTVPG